MLGAQAGTLAIFVAPRKLATTSLCTMSYAHSALNYAVLTSYLATQAVARSEGLRRHRCDGKIFGVVVGVVGEFCAFHCRGRGRIDKLG